jgi:hypothetical protein
MELLTFINIPYTLAVIFSTELFKKYFPQYKDVFDAKGLSLVLAAFIAGIFIAFHGWDDKQFNITLFVSWLGSVACYDFLIKPLKKWFEKEKEKEYESGS